MIFFPFIIMLIFGYISTNGSFILPKKGNASINNLAVSILTACYPERNTVVLCDSPNSHLVQALWISPSISVIFYDSATFKITFSKKNKMNLFVMSFESNRIFKNTLRSLKNTPWWNIMATFLILDETNECKNAENILKTVWKMNIPISIFLCRDIKGLMMFTFNPYTNRAPKSWKRIKIEAQRNNRWTLYSRPYNNNDHSLCSFRFNRMRHLDKYKVKSTSAIFYSNSSLLNPDYDPSKLSNGDFVRVDIANVFKRALNINLTVGFFEYDYQDPKCIYQGLGEGIYDLTLGLLPMHAIDEFPLIYPVIQYETTIVMQKRGYYTPLEKIMNFYGVLTIISIIAVLTIVFFVIKNSQKKKSIAFVMFEMIRLLTNSALVSKINTLPIRIFFFVIFVYFLVMQATFTGHLAAFLTKQELRKTPEKSKDLEDSSIEVIYIPENVSFYYSSSTLYDKVILMNNYDCGSVVLNNTNAVCLNNKPDLLSLAARYKNLHVSKKPLAADFYSFIARKDWPLKDRADTMVMWFSDLGYSSCFWKYKIAQENEDNMRRAVERSFVKYRPVSLADFNFAFVILVLGLTLSKLCFLFEINH